MSWEEMMEHGVGGGDPDDGYEVVDHGYADCVICGEPIDYCRGHSEEEHDRLGRCALCGEDIKPTDERAEMHGPGKPRWGVHDVEVTDGIVHAQCGLNAGWEIS